jgi:glycosyltransferase involved in cell wall biosynthesis
MKAPQVAADALSECLSADRGMRATWVCEKGSHEAVRFRLRESVRERVKLLDWMSRERLREVFDDHGIFLFTSYTEGFGKVFLEAMARGLCVVATDQGGARDVIRSGTNGLLAPVGDVRALASAVRRLSSTPELSRAISSEARRTSERYTWRRVVEELTAFYHQRLAAEGRSGEAAG